MRRFSSCLICSLALIFLLLGAGCSITSVYNRLDAPGKTRPESGTDKSGLKKKVLLMPILNQAALNEKRMSEITNLFTSLLEKDPNLLLERTTEPLPSTMTMRSPRYGIVMDADAAKRAEEKAANVLLSIIMNSYEMRLTRVGIWPLRKLKREVEISMSVSALDLTNGTLFLTSNESEKLEFGMEELEDEEDIPQKPEMPEIDDKTFTRTMTKIIERQASQIRSALKTQPWTGRILSSDGSRIVISAGKKVGVSKDRVFEVFNRGEQIRSASGGAIYLLGPKVGDIKVTEVMDDYSYAQLVFGAEFRAGQIIRAKRK